LDWVGLQRLHGTTKEAKNFNVDGTAKSTFRAVVRTDQLNEWSVYGRLGAASTRRKGTTGFGASSTDLKTETDVWRWLSF
jgi:hypothetical protein